MSQFPWINTWTKSQEPASPVQEKVTSGNDSRPAWP